MAEALGTFLVVVLAVLVPQAYRSGQRRLNKVDRRLKRRAKDAPDEATDGTENH